MENTSHYTEVEKSSPINNNNEVRLFFLEIRSILERLCPKGKGYGELSKQINVDRSTIWRWHELICKTFPDPTKILRLLIYDSKLTLVRNIAKHYDGRISSFLTVSFASQIYKPLDKAQDFCSVQDQYDFCIYYICGTQRGATEHELIIALGHIALKKAELTKEYLSRELVISYGQIATTKIKKLVDRKVIFKDKDGFYKRTQMNVSIDVEKGIHHIIQLLKDIFNPQDAPRGLLTSYAFQESIPTEIAKEIVREQYECYKRCKDKMEKHKSNDPNTTPFMIKNFAGKLLFEQNESSQGELLQ